MPRKSTIDQAIERIYAKHCSGMQIVMTRIPELWRNSKALLIDGTPEDVVGQYMVDFINGKH